MGSYTDDVGILCKALAATASHIKPEHVAEAKETLVLLTWAQNPELRRMLFLTARTEGCNLIKQSSPAVEDLLLKAFMLELDTAPKTVLTQQTD